MEVAADDISLLGALREHLGVCSVKDGCSPQGQCGCCTVLVDGAARVACVTPIRRVADREVTTVDGLPADQRRRLVNAFTAHGASQCGFCTPGILCRLAALGPTPSPGQVESALLAHLCRCTGWRSIVAAALDAAAPDRLPGRGAERRAELEGGTPQRMGPGAVLGRGGFADDLAPEDALVAVPDADAGWAVGETLAEARARAGKVQGRRSGQPLVHPIEVPPGRWDLTLQTTWVEPAYLEPDASWCLPGGEPASPVANGGAFGGKLASAAPSAARRLADEHGRPVRVVYSREDVVRLGPKRPPVAAGILLDGTGVMRVAAGAGVDIRPFDRLAVEEVEVRGPPLSALIRAGVWAEAAVLVAAARSAALGRVDAVVETAEGAWARAVVGVDSSGWPSAVEVSVDAGDPLDEVVLRSYVQGASHMALGWVCSEGVAVGDDGEPSDLTIRSFGIVRARDMPTVDVTIRSGEDPGPPQKVSDAVFAAVAAATWIAQDLPPRWPTRRGERR